MEEIIFTKEELARITKDVEHPNAWVIDVHGMSCQDAWRTIHNLAVLLKHQKSDKITITVIHGYLGGVAIKKSIWSRPVVSRATMKSYAWNPGVTTIQVA